MSFQSGARRYSAIRGAAVTAVALTMLSSSANAVTSLVDSHASDIQVNVDILGFLSGSLGPFTYASGQEDADNRTYSDSQTFLSAAASGDITTLGALPNVTGLKITTGTLTSSASGTFNPIVTMASSEVEDLTLALKEVGLVPLISLGGDNSDIKSMSVATNPFSGPKTVSGASSIAGLTLSVLGISIDLSAYYNAAPNTPVVLTGLATALTGLAITVNKQTVVDSGGAISIQTDAIDIDFTNLSLGGIVPIRNVASGDIIIAQSFAQVPEPAAWAEMLLGFACLGGLVRNRRRLSIA
jgi:hypothetical protein